MNGLKFLAVTALVWLTGCATEPLPDGRVPVADRKPATKQQTAIAEASPRVNAVVGNNAPLSPIAAQQTTSRTVTSLAAPADLWERIRRGYAMPNLESDLVHDREQWYATRQDYIFRMTERSRKYLFHIVEELERRNMPS